MTEHDDWVISGPADPDILACGHSHVIAMEMAVRAGLATDSPSAGVCYGPQSSLKRLGVTTYWDFVVEKARGRTVAVLWNGNQHNIDFLIEPEPPIRLVASRSGRTEGSGTWIPQEMLRAHWRATNDELERQLDRLVPVARGVLVVGTPPPKPDEFVTEVLRTDVHFATAARELGRDPRVTPVTPGPTRLALWSVVQDMLADSAAISGATFLPVPAAVSDDEGYLRPVLSTSDATHANTAYAYLVWQAIAGAVNERPS
jgi:hypothetical protein